MKLKIKLPLIFLIMFILIIFSVLFYLTAIMEAEESVRLRNVLNPVHLEMFLFVLALTGVIFIIMTVYLHFNITKPIQTLDKRLENIHIRHSDTSLYSKRKDEIGGLYKRFNDMEVRLQQAHKEQLDMIAAMAHDLKTPLTSINGFMELLVMQKNLSDKEKQEYYELILKKSKHITELINGFSSFTRDELGLEAMDMKPVEASKLFENIAERHKLLY